MKSESKLKLVAVLSVVIFVFAIFAIAFIFKDMSGEYPNLLLYRKEDGIYMTNFGKGKTTKLDAQISNHGTESVRMASPRDSFIWMILIIP